MEDKNEDEISLPQDQYYFHFNQATNVMRLHHFLLLQNHNQIVTGKFLRKIYYSLFLHNSVTIRTIISS